MENYPFISQLSIIGALSFEYFFNNRALGRWILERLKKTLIHRKYLTTSCIVNIHCFFGTIDSSRKERSTLKDLELL